MEKITVWTKQHKHVLEVLEKDKRYVAKKEYINIDSGQDAPLVLSAYDWLVKNTPNTSQKPKDAEYPIWVSLKKEATAGA